ncbi:MAG TPA: methyltransferase domain-containing protein [Thermoanaerobaculia bacterium]|nr:methyltransferase domain-containing protein [Thermoanaerobaculia bacterium]
MTESTYIHGTAPEEQRRLSLLNDVLLNPASLHEIGLQGSERIIDFGSGLGQFTRAMARAASHGKAVGIERNEEQLALARRLAAEDGEAELVEFRQGDVLGAELEWGTYDLAHTRFVLEHVPDPLRVVKTMVRAVRPGGRVILADDDHDVLRMWPESPGFAELWRAYMRTYDRIGNDPFIGRRLVQLLHEAGAQPVRNTWIFFGGCAGMEIFPTLAANMRGVVWSARDAILSMGLFEETAFDVVMSEAELWAARKDAAIWFSMAWAEGRRPQLSS